MQFTDYTRSNNNSSKIITRVANSQTDTCKDAAWWPEKSFEFIYIMYHRIYIFTNYGEGKLYHFFAKVAMKWTNAINRIEL